MLAAVPSLVDDAYGEMLLRLGLAMFAGGAIGLERSYHGRPAGFRTHTLVCLSTALLMLITVYEDYWVPASSRANVTLDPTRMSQGIMTGIGFLGAGAILKEGLTVRGLTTAASIWMTAAIGILAGIGFYFPGMVATIATLGTLTFFRWIETRIPMQFYAHFVVRFAREQVLPESDLRALVSVHDFTIAHLNYRLDAREGFFEYRMVIRSSRASNVRTLTETLKQLPSVLQFRISPTGD
ncbi:MAG: MgtC/SapB family protein [Planctomycetes bacterium]|nr:MgtC/SapB family protein [Planctomycetota bacterium]